MNRERDYDVKKVVNDHNKGSRERVFLEDVCLEIESHRECPLDRRLSTSVLAEVLYLIFHFQTLDIEGDRLNITPGVVSSTRLMSIGGRTISPITLLKVITT